MLISTHHVKEEHMSEQGRFIWYDLVTTDLAAATRFYSAVVGWKIEDSGNPTQQYLVLHPPGESGMGVGGLMALPPGLRDAGMTPHWSGYAYVHDVDAMAKRVVALGGKVGREPSDIPHVGRFAWVSDPTGASFYLFKPNGTGELKDASTPGYVGWRELHSADDKAAITFYAELLAWKKDREMDMGPQGTYTIFSTKDGQRGGIMRGAPSSWLFYFTVASVDAAVAACKREGGEVLGEPHQEPEGGWIVRCKDPQGALFAVVGSK
jgi:predicted enzyme related to lactoylglutathione lyase